MVDPITLVMGEKSSGGPYNFGHGRMFSGGPYNFGHGRMFSE